ncbi:MAG: IS630 family transposase [Thermoplasmata archaeon]
MLFVRQLTQDEVDTFKKVSKCAIDGRLALRYQAIWFSHLGKSVQEIAELLDVSEESVRNWIHIFEEEGFEGLADDWRSGRPPKANEAYIERLLDMVHISPLLVGYSVTSWTLPLLAEYMEKETGVRLSGERIRQLLLKSGVRFRRAKLCVASDDPDYDIKRRRIDKLLAAPAKRIVILFEDETELHLNSRIQKTRQRVGEPMKVNAAGKDRKLNLFGTVNPGTGTIVARFCQRKRGSDFVAFLRQVARRYRGWKVKIVLDNYGVHFTKRVQEFLDGLDGRIELVPLPTYSPHLNPIEGFWLFLKSHVLSNHLYEDLKELKRTVLRFLRHIENGRMEGYNFPIKNGKNLFAPP